MFGLTKKSEYGLQLMVYLGQHTGKEPMSLREVAKTQKLPYRFLTQVAADLKKAKLIKSKEGVGGGYLLARSAGKISVAEILEVLEGPIELVDCLQAGSSCPHAAICGQRQMFAQMKGSMSKIMGAHTLKDLLPKEKR